MPASPKHSVYVPELDPAAQTVVLTGEEAKHAVRVKRLQPGQAVNLMNGNGLRLTGDVTAAKRELHIRVTERVEVPRPSPALEVCSAVPKGPRSGDMLDGLSQAGADVWCPLETAFGVESPTPAKRDRWERISRESLKQCGRAWRMEIGPDRTLAGACEPGAGLTVVIADASGEPYEAAAGAERVRLLVGPEGGWREDELEFARAAGARACRFGPHVMRIETAAVVAAGIIRAAHG